LVPHNSLSQATQPPDTFSPLLTFYPSRSHTLPLFDSKLTPRPQYTSLPIEEVQEYNACDSQEPQQADTPVDPDIEEHGPREHDGGGRKPGSREIIGGEEGSRVLWVGEW
jgi:hypothetical protein